MKITILRKGKGSHNSGNLLIRISKQEAQELKEAGASYYAQLDKFLYQLEKYSCNGSFAYLTADELGALSESPCIADIVNYDDKGELIEPSRTWFHSNYTLTNFVETLRDDREVIFQKA